MGRHRSSRVLVATATALTALTLGGTAAEARVESDEPKVVLAGDRLALDFDIVHNPELNEYFAVWRDSNGSLQDVVGQRLAADGTPLGSPIVVAAQTANGTAQLQAKSPPRVAYNTATNQYVVAFGRQAFREDDFSLQPSTLLGQLISDQGALVGAERSLYQQPSDVEQNFCTPLYPDLVGDPGTGGYALAFTRLCAGETVTVVQALDGALGGGALIDFPGSRDGGQPFPRIAYNSVTEQFMVTQVSWGGNLSTREYYRFEAQVYNSAMSTVAPLRTIDVDPITSTGAGAPNTATPTADSATGNWFVVSAARFRGPAWMNSLSPTGESLGTGTRILGSGRPQNVAPVGDGTFVFSMGGSETFHVRANGTVIHMTRPLPPSLSPEVFTIAMGAGGRGVGIGLSATDHVSVGFRVVAPGTLPVAPARLLDTRSGAGVSTVDGQALGEGKVAGGVVKVLQVAGRGGVPADAGAVNLNVTAAGAAAVGFVTVFPCDADQPNTSNLNYTSGGAASAAAFAGLSAAGTVCVFTSATSHLIVDVNGFVPSGGSVEPLVPARLLDSRAAGETIDGVSQAEGRVDAGSTTTLTVANRGGVAGNADAVIVNVTAVNPSSNAFLTVFPCDEDQPAASNLNAAAGAIVNNLVLAKISAEGTTCVFSSAETHLLVDVAAFVPDGGGLLSIVPARLLETRAGSTTVDGRSQSTSPVGTESTTTLQVAGRGGVADDATGAVLNVAAIRPDDGGFITAYPCDEDRPQASNVNFGAGAVVSNAVVVKLDSNGSVCLYSTSRTDLAVDVVGYSVDS